MTPPRHKRAGGRTGGVALLYRYEMMEGLGGGGLSEYDSNIYCCVRFFYFFVFYSGVMVFETPGRSMYAV